MSAATAVLKEGARVPLEAYLRTYMFEPASHAQYLERIGFERILSLYEV